MASPPCSSPCIVSNPAAKSEVWQHFGFPRPEDGSGTIATKKRVVCCICHQDMSYKNNTSNLFSHLERHHKKEHQQLHKRDSEGQADSKLGCQPSQHRQLVQAVGNFIVEDLEPISVVEGKGFRKLMKVAEPRFNVPSWIYFSQNVIPGKYIELRQEAVQLG